MPFKPNYRMQRADRKRAQAEKQQKKLERRAAREAERKGDADSPEAAGPPSVPGDETDEERGV
jgi:hypothetical protein